MKNLYVFSVLMAWVFTLNLHAQEITLKTPDMTVDPGANFQLSVQVEDFDAITGIQFSVNWDPAVLEYIGTDTYSLPDMTADNFGTTEAAEGKLRFSWYHLQQTGYSVDDMSAIFQIVFKAIGDPSDQTTVSISDEPIVMEAVNLDGEVPINVTSGVITIEGVNAATETVTGEFTLFQNSPNPFTDMTTISFFLNSADDVQLNIHDTAGKVVYSQNRFFNSGLNTVQIDRDLFSSAGSYFFTLTTDNATATRQMIAR